MDIKPCPFCGEPAYVPKDGEYDTYEYYVTCSSCEAEGPHSELPYISVVNRPASDNLMIMKDAIKQWNKRIDK